MDNFTRFKDSILKVASNTGDCPRFYKNEILPCDPEKCLECDFYDPHEDKTCTRAFIEWLYEEVCAVCFKDNEKAFINGFKGYIMRCGQNTYYMVSADNCANLHNSQEGVVNLNSLGIYFYGLDENVVYDLEELRKLIKENE